MKINAIQQGMDSGSSLSSGLKSVPVLLSLVMIGISGTAAAHHGGKHHHKHHGKCHHRHHHHGKHHRRFWDDKKVHFRGITITPGGYLDGSLVWRSRTLFADTNTSLLAIPTQNNAPAFTDELRFSARASRASMLIEGDYSPQVHVSGYYETDWWGSGPASTYSVTNSFVNRIRHLYSTVDWVDSGWHFLAGHAYSLATSNTKGITPRNEAIPPEIEGAFVTGFVYKRQPQFRLTKNWGKSLWAAVSVEQPVTTIAGTNPCGGNTVFGTQSTGTAQNTLGGNLNTITCAGVGTGNLPQTVFYTLDHIPDVHGKLAYEGDFDGRSVHLEAFGFYRDFFDRVYYNPAVGAPSAVTGVHANLDTTAWGAGFGTFLEVMPKFLDVQANVIWGQGIGSYVTSGLPDATFGVDGSLQPIREVAFMVNATMHATPQLDVYVGGGDERAYSNFYFDPVSNAYHGYGIPTANNTGCYTDGASGTAFCNGVNKETWQVTGGMWDKIYEGWFGDVRVGLQYSYTKRILFAGTGQSVANIGSTGLAVGPTQDANTDVHMAFASVRYYPFTTPAAVKPAAFVK